MIKSGQFGSFDLIHFQDWHFSLIPTLIKYDPRYRELARIATLGTIHNVFSWGYIPEKFEQLSGLSQIDHQELYKPWQGLLHGPEMHFLKGVQHADMANTVSPRYAQELLTPERGSGFQGFFKHLYDSGRFTGILNGLDEGWDPANDGLIAAKFSPDDLSGKAACKAELRNIFGLLDQPNAPVIGILSRITPQKGFDILIPSFQDIINSGAQIAILGSGDNKDGYIDRLAGLSLQFPGKFLFKSGHSEEIAHKIFAGSDILIYPSFYEPCGLTHMQGMKYGTVPVVHRTGGLADTVMDIDEDRQNGNGFDFMEYSAKALQASVSRAMDHYCHDPDLWRTLILRGMSGDYSWRKIGDRYLDIYEKALANARARNEK